MAKNYVKSFYNNRGGINVTKIGDWRKANRVIGNLTTTVPESAAIIYALAEQSKNRIKSNIERQVYPWPELSPETVNTKAQKGQDPRILIATGSFLDSIKVIPLSNGGAAVGISSNATNSEGQNLSEIGMWHEYGTQDMPPRPMWRRESTVFKGQLAAALSQLMKQKVSLRG